MVPLSRSNHFKSTAATTTVSLEKPMKIKRLDDKFTPRMNEEGSKNSSTRLTKKMNEFEDVNDISKHTVGAGSSTTKETNRGEKQEGELGNT
jgi:hypothetical protein